MITDELELKVLRRFAVELAEAGAAQFDHLAQRAEGNYATELGARMHELVDYERAARVVGLR